MLFNILNSPILILMKSQSLFVVVIGQSMFNVSTTSWLPLTDFPICETMVLNYANYLEQNSYIGIYFQHQIDNTPKKEFLVRSTHPLRNLLYVIRTRNRNTVQVDARPTQPIPSHTSIDNTKRLLRVNGFLWREAKTT